MLAGGAALQAPSAHRHALGDIRLVLQRLEEDVELVGDARVGALALGREREAAPVLGQPQRPQQVRRVLGQEAARRDTGFVRAAYRRAYPPCK